ncbi:MAG: HAMP domain-containing sensor histidine kinase [Phycisphaerales bacterium]
MKLQVKFLGLMAILGLAVAINVATAWWAIRTLERELAWPLDSMQRVLDGLHDAQMGVERQSAAIGMLRGAGGRVVMPAEPDPENRAAFLDASDDVRQRFERLEAMPTFRLRSGVSTTRNLKDRTAAVRALGERWFDGDTSVGNELGAQIAQSLELIERVQGRIITDAALAVDFGESLRRRALTVLIISVLMTLVCVALGVLFVRRWVLRPVGELRGAALRYASGDLSHRVRVSGKDELSTLGAEFNEMAETIAKMQRESVERERLAAVGEMSGRIVHNLRSPLAGIRSLAEMTRDELPQESDLREAQTRIVNTLDRFEGWLQQLLRASAPLDLEVTRCEARAWLTEVVEAQRAAAEGRGVALACGVEGAPLQAVFDRRHLEHALVALLSNAIEATPRGGTVRVEGFSDAGSGCWAIRVSDEGPGVAEGEAERIFRPYYTTKSGGTGIGLALAQRVARQHGGEIRVENRPESAQGPGGATFVLDLPLDAGWVVAHTGQGSDVNGQDSGHRG